MKESILFLKNIIKENDIVVCATSGGVDSMCLLDLLINLRKSTNFNIVCAHVNHNLREESFEEYEFVRKYCAQNNIIFEGIVFDKNVKGNFEGESRKKRYDFFDEIMQKYKANYLLTAHHGDDLIETVLMRLTRGSTLDGYSGFKKITQRNNYKILRPLVYVTKSDLYSYAEDRKLEYREDKTNKDLKYTRNRYRQNILPLLKNENSNVHLKFLKFSEEIDEASNFIDKYVNNIYEELYINNSFDINELKKLDTYILRKLLIKLFSNVYGLQINKLESKHIDLVIHMINSNKSNAIVDLPMDIKAIKKYNKLEFKTLKNLKEYKYEIKDDKVLIPSGFIEPISNTNLTNNYVCHLNSKDIKLPLYVRNKEDGDYIEVLGLNGKKKIKDIFIDEKVDIEKRKSYPVVVDSDNNIVWLPGLKKSKYDTLKSKNYDIILWYSDKEENYD